MTDPRWQRLMTLFEKARELPPDERDGWLAVACGDDVELKLEVRSLLAADARSAGILEFSAPASLAPPFPDLGAILGDRYEIERELGEGGMARVFLAHETKHGRRVVLKVLKPEVASWYGRDRFLREVRIAAQLAHPHIVGLIDSGEAGGLLYYVMPYLPGETLRQRLQSGPLEAVTAQSLLRDIADALRFAHGAGVVHRDLKPDNVLCVDRHAYLLDFGIAKLLQPDPGTDHQTRTGHIVGTPAYMAPEQRAGEAVNHRADLYTWGVLAYECLTGRLPGATWMAHATDDLTSGRPDLPPAVASVVVRCLSLDPAGRPADAEELVRTLDGVAITPVVRPADRAGTRRWRAPLLLAAGGAAALLVWTGLNRTATPHTGAVAQPISVAGFSNETGDSTLDTWGRLAGDWITQGLQETELVQVVPWPTSRLASERIRADRGAGQPVDPVALIRAETKAGTVITGSYYRFGDSLQFHAVVSDAVHGRTLVTLPPISCPVSDPAPAIAELRRRLMGVMALWTDERVAGVPGIARRPPTYEAYQVFDQALDRFRTLDYGAADSGFRRAFALDTAWVPALLYAAVASWNRRDFGGTDTLLRAARAREPALSEYQRLRLRALEAAMAGDGTAQLAALRHAVELAPHGTALYNVADVALNTDHPDEALSWLVQADPDRGELRGWYPYWIDLTHARHLANDHLGERQAARELRRRYPDQRIGLVLEVRAVAATGDTAAVERLLEEGVGLPPSTYWSQGAALVVAGEEMMAHGFGQAGWPYLSRAVQWLDHQLQLHPRDRPHRYWLATALYDLGDWRRAYRVALTLAQDYPNRLTYRGLAAVTAARLRLPTADSLLGSPAPYQQGDHLMLRARFAAIRGDPAEALGLFNEAVQYGVDGLPWIHASAVYDLFLLGDRRASLPASLRAGLAPIGRTPRGP